MAAPLVYQVFVYRLTNMSGSPWLGPLAAALGTFTKSMKPCSAMMLMWYKLTFSLKRHRLFEALLLCVCLRACACMVVHVCVWRWATETLSGWTSYLENENWRISIGRCLTGYQTNSTNTRDFLSPSWFLQAFASCLHEFLLCWGIYHLKGSTFLTGTVLIGSPSSSVA